MLKKIILGFCLSICAAFALFAGGMAASAITVEDLWNAALDAGLSEDEVRYAFNEATIEKGDPSLWTEEQKQKVMDELTGKTHNYLSTGPQQKPIVTTTTTAVTDPSSSAPGTDTPEPAQTPITPAYQPVILTMEDGTTITRISVKEFIALSYEEKQAYIASFPPEQQQFIIDNLTPEEKRSTIKQLPVDKKVEVIDGMKGFMNEFGVQLTIDDITDDTVKLTMLNEDGEVIGKSSLGKDVVENTGYDRRWVYCTAGGLFVVALAAVMFVIRRSIVKENTANEKN